MDMVSLSDVRPLADAIAGAVHGGR